VLLCRLFGCSVPRGESLSEFGDALAVDSIHLQASDVSEADDILIEGRDSHGETHRSSIAVRRNPAPITRGPVGSLDSRLPGGRHRPLVRSLVGTLANRIGGASFSKWTGRGRADLAVSFKSQESKLASGEDGRADRTTAINSLQRMLQDGMSTAVDVLFSRIEELVGSENGHRSSVGPKWS